MREESGAREESGRILTNPRSESQIVEQRAGIGEEDEAHRRRRRQDKHPHPPRFFYLFLAVSRGNRIERDPGLKRRCQVQSNQGMHLAPIFGARKMKKL